MGEAKLLLTIPECADRLGLGRSFMYELVQRGEIASLKLGRARRVAVAELERYVGPAPGRAGRQRWLLKNGARLGKRRAAGETARARGRSLLLV